MVFGGFREARRGRGRRRRRRRSGGLWVNDGGEGAVSGVHHGFFFVHENLPASALLTAETLVASVYIKITLKKKKRKRNIL